MQTPITSRRELLKAGAGFGYLAFAGMIGQAAQSARAAHAGAVGSAVGGPLAARMPHFGARAKRVIFLFMQGGPPQVDTFDYKPDLQKNHDKKVKGGKLLKSPFDFIRGGESGLPISDAFPYLAQHADDLCLLNGMRTDNPAHPQATILLHTGSATFVRPSVGSWVVYGLGTHNQNLPGFITINPTNRLGGAQNYGNAFLPAAYQGTRIGDRGNSLPNIANRYFNASQQRQQLNLVQDMNQSMLDRTQVNPEVEGLIESYELGFRMQSAVPEVMNISDESEATQALYGIGDGPSDRFGRQCLMARRFAEAGVRFIELTHGGWDLHNNLSKRLGTNAQQIDKPIAGLIADLKQRGLFEDTPIVWGGEFGRSAVGQNNDGRRHNHEGFSMWLAGGGVKGGIRHGATDEFGAQAVENKIHTHDLHATILHLLGLDHERLTYRYAGRDFRLTDVYGNVAREVIA